MRTVHFRSVSIVALAVVALAGSVAAQEKPSGLLNTLEVRQLVKRAEPGDNARLAVHFTALAERYAADARRHETMARSLEGHARGQTSTALEGHCRALAKNNTEMATIAHELASYHDKMAAGAPATPPADAKGLEAGKGAPKPTDQELAAFLEKASANADHKAMADYFDTLRKRYEADATTHASMAAAYRGTRIAPAAVNCERLIALARGAAKEAREAAEMHQQLAGDGHR
jgi:hypothetical protein